MDDTVVPTPGSYCEQEWSLEKKEKKLQSLKCDPRGENPDIELTLIFTFIVHNPVISLRKD